MPPNTLPPNVSRSLSISSEKSLGFQYPAKRYPLGSCPAFPGSFLLVQLPSQNRELDYIDYPLFSTVLCFPLNIFTLPSLERKGVGRGQRGRRAEEKKEGERGTAEERREEPPRPALSPPSVTLLPFHRSPASQKSRMFYTAFFALLPTVLGPVPSGPLPQHRPHSSHSQRR